MDTLKLYSLDAGVYGLTVVVAYNIDQATKLIAAARPYGKIFDGGTVEAPIPYVIEEHEIADGTTITNWGDS